MGWNGPAERSDDADAGLPCLIRHGRSSFDAISKAGLCRATRTGYISVIIRIFRGWHEFSVVVFTAQDRSVPAQASPGDGAADADARREAESGAALAQHRLLRAARHAGRIDHRGSLADRGDRFWESRRARHLFRGAGHG